MAFCCFIIFAASPGVAAYEASPDALPGTKSVREAPERSATLREKENFD